MSAATQASASQDAAPAYELAITRTFDAPRELVWQALTNETMMQEWMGPRGFETTEMRFEAKVGTRWSRKMQGPARATQEMAFLGQTGTVLEVRPPEKLVYTFAWEERGNLGLPPSPYAENTITILLEERGSKTVMRFTQTPFAFESERNGHSGGWQSTFDKLGEFLGGLHPGRAADPAEAPSELHLQRVFAAPIELVFAAWTDPKHLAAWWGPTNFTNPRCEFEPRTGGALHIDMQGPDGRIYPMAGTVAEYYPPHRIHFTASALDAEGRPMFTNWNSVFFEAVEGGTRVTLDVHVMEQTDVAPQYLKGMQAGWMQSLDKLAAFLASHI